MYGVIISLAIGICIYFANNLAKIHNEGLRPKGRSLLFFVPLSGAQNKNAQILWNVAFITIVCGIVGARLYHVIDYIEYYKTDPIKILDIRAGGLGIYGAIIGGFIGEYVYLTLVKENRYYWLNITGVVAPLGQVIGRFGNFFNQELYGKATSLPWAISINGQSVHPLFLYESILTLLLFLYLYKKAKSSDITKTYDLLILYLQGYAVIRFILEPFRVNAWTLYGLNVAQMISILIIIFSYVFIHRIRSRRI